MHNYACQEQNSVSPVKEATVIVLKSLCPEHMVAQRLQARYMRTGFETRLSSARGICLVTPIGGGGAEYTHPPTNTLEAEKPFLGQQSSLSIPMPCPDAHAKRRHVAKPNCGWFADDLADFTCPEKMGATLWTTDCRTLESTVFIR